MSGGQDSTTCLYWAKQNFEKVFALGFDYGQKHKIELQQARKIATIADVFFKIIDIPPNLLGYSSLNVHDLDHNKTHFLNPGLPLSFTPGRNILFLLQTAIFGTAIDCSDIVTGVCQTDYSGYPDCRKTTMQAMELVLSLGLGAGDFKIHTPLMYLTKAETWKLANELRILPIIINDTMTDYNGDQTMNDWGMGNIDNPASKLRAKGYYEAKEKGWI